MGRDIQQPGREKRTPTKTKLMTSGNMALILHPKSQGICMRVAARLSGGRGPPTFVIQDHSSQDNSLTCCSEGLEIGIRLPSQGRASQMKAVNTQAISWPRLSHGCIAFESPHMKNERLCKALAGTCAKIQDTV